MRSLIRSATVILGLTTLLVTAVVPATANVRRAVPDEDPYAPIYARSLHVENPSSTWVPVIFYRSTSCVPTTYDLVAMFDLSAWSCPLVVQGHVVYDAADDLENFRSPALVRLQGNAVPVWFVLRTDWEAAGGTADFTGSVTRAELEAMPSLIRGTATTYREVLHPVPTFAGGGAQVVGDLYHATGTLEGGGSFRLQVTGHQDPHGDPMSLASYRLHRWQVAFS